MAAFASKAKHQSLLIMRYHLTAVPDKPASLQSFLNRCRQTAKNSRQVCYSQGYSNKVNGRPGNPLLKIRNVCQETPLHTNERWWHSWEPSISWRRGHHSRWRHTIDWRWHYSGVDWLDCRSWGWDGCRGDAISGGNAKGGWHCQRFLAHATLALQVTHAGLHAFSLAAGLVQITTLCTWLFEHL